MKNSCSDAKMADSLEESSWTFYIQGFMCDQNNDDDDDSCSSEYESPSLVSDAASSPVKKLKNSSSVGFPYSGKSSNRIMIGKQNSFKKQQIKNAVMPVIMDLDLEDTASSPVNSPRASHINEFMNQKEKGKLDVADDQVKKGRSS